MNTGNRMNLKSLFSVLIVSALMVLSASCHSGSGSPKMQWVDCPDFFPADAGARCGYLTVPENRDDPDSPLIENYVVVFKALDGSSSAGPSSEGPVFFLNGGPGATNYYAMLAFMSPENPMRQMFGTNRDIVITAQRGTNGSKPSLYYQGLEGDRALAYEMNFDEESEQRITATMRNYDRFVSEGIDLSGYDTLEIADDVKALRDTLYPGKKINIWSASYGTRLAMTLMKRYPEMLRSVLLDSILPPETNPFLEEIPGILYAFDRFFDATRDDFPDLETYYNAILDRLESGPAVTLPTEVDGVTYSVGITATKFFLFVKGSLQSTPYDPDLPQDIIDIYKGNYTKIAQAWIGNVQYEFPVGDYTDEATCDAVFESVFAATDANFTTPAKTQAAIDLYVERESIKTYFRHQFITGYPCSEGSWVVDLLPESMQDPVISGIPTLMVVGTLDPSTPAPFSKGSAARMTNAYYYEILGGHAVSELSCVQDMVSAFYTDPATPPANPCAATYSWTGTADARKTAAPETRGRLFSRQF